MRANELGQPIGEPVRGWQPKGPVQPVVLTGRGCRLEPLSSAHADGLYEALVQRSAPRVWTYMFHGPFSDRPSFDAYLLALHELPGVTPFAVLATDGTELGIMTYLRDDPANGSVEVGHIALSGSLQRTTLATEAMFLMARHVFDDLGYRRFEWKCDCLNEPSRRAASRFGFTYEGVFRNALVYKGRNRDTAWFAMTNDDWQRLRPAYEAWLDLANFDPDGCQLKALSTLTKEALQ